MGGGREGEEDIEEHIGYDGKAEEKRSLGRLRSKWVDNGSQTG
jgi:hypothetical protein